jgi:hypothetical protein
VLFNGDGSKLAGTRVGTSQIDSFTVGSGGLLTAAPGSPFSAQGLGPFGSEFCPTNPGQLFVSNAHNTGTGTVSVFADSADGTLTPIGSSPFADDQTAPCWVEISHDGQFLARPLAADLRLPWERPAPPGRLTPARVRRGFRNLRATLPRLASAPKPGKPGPGRPPGSHNRRPAPRYDVGKTTKRERSLKAKRERAG